MKEIINKMDKKTKLLISEFVNKTSHLDKTQIQEFFKTQEYNKLKSFEENNDLIIITEYVQTVMGMTIENIDNSGNDIKSFPKTHISLLLMDQSLSSIGRVIRFPYYEHLNLDESIRKSLLNFNIEDNIIKQFNSVLDNRTSSQHSVDFVYYIYTEDTDMLTPVFEFDFKSLPEEYVLIYVKYLDSLLMNSFDKDVIDKIRRIKKRLINE